MRWILFLFASLLLPWSLIGQQTINPFDLPERMPDSLQTQTVITDSGETTVQVAPKEQVTIRSRPKAALFSIWYLPFLVALVAWAVSMNRDSIKKLYRSMTNLNFLNLMHRDQRSRLTPAFVILYVVFLGSTAYFIKFGLSYFALASFPSFSWILLFLVAIYLTRTVVMRIIHFAFSGPVEIPRYDYTIFIFSIVLGLFLLPLNIFIAFSPDSVARLAIWLGLIGMILLFLFRCLRGLLMSTDHLGRNTFRYFMYICSLEIAPILLMIKVIRDGAI